MPAPAASNSHCLNCEAPLSGRFCSACGQKDGPRKITLRALFGEFASETFEIDGRVPATLRPFFFAPGELTREYVAGRRRRFTAPLRLFLAMGVLWVLTGFALSQWDELRGVEARPVLDVSEGAAGAPSEDLDGVSHELPADSPLRDGPGLVLGQGGAISFHSGTGDKGESMATAMGLGDSAVGRALDRRVAAFEALPPREQGQRLQEAAREVVPTVALLLLPLFSVGLWISMFRSGRTLPEHGIFALHTHAMGLLVVTVVRLVGRAGSGVQGGADATAALIGAVFFGLYVLLSLRRAYALSWWSALWRWSLLALGFALSTALVYAVTLLGSALGG